MNFFNKSIFIVLFFVIITLSGCFTTRALTGETKNPFSDEKGNSTRALYKLIITTNIKNAHIYLNGNFMGNDSISPHLREGVYQIKVKARGYIIWEQALDLNKTTSIHAQLIKDLN